MLITLFFTIARIFIRDKFNALSKNVELQYLKVRERDLNDFSLLIEMLIIAEDRRFFFHPGFDLIAIVRALKNRLLYGKVEGASTIAQQLVRVLTGQYERSISRKFSEIILAVALRRIVPKRFIPLIYLNTAYYGTGIYGFQKVLKEEIFKEALDIHQAAYIVARIKYPEPLRNCPIRKKQIRNRENYLKRLYEVNKKYIINKICVSV